MPGWLQVLLGVLGGLLLLWLALLAVLAVQARRQGRGLDVREALRLVPDVVRLIGRLVRAPEVPLRTRVVLALLLGYLLMPIDLVPDFIPVIGYADDAIVVAVALRLALRTAGRAPVEASWPGTEQGLQAVLRLAGPGR